MTSDAAVHQRVISNWHPFKVTQQSKRVTLTSRPAVVKTEELKREWGRMINIYMLSCLFLPAALLPNSISRFGLLHISVSSLPVLPFSTSVIFAFSPSAPICFLFLLSLPPPSLFCSQPIVTFFPPSRGLRPTVAVWFELFQEFSLQQGGIVMVLAECGSGSQCRGQKHIFYIS